MRIDLIGIGSGAAWDLSKAAAKRLLEAELVIGASRVLEYLELAKNCKCIALVDPKMIIEQIENSGCERICIVYSGDTGFYSGAKSLLPYLNTVSAKIAVIPGISSMQLLASELKRDWQDWHFYSAHGRQIDPILSVMQGGCSFFLTDSKESPQWICRQLDEAGLGGVFASVGVRLGYPDQEIYRGTVSELARKEYESPAVLLVDEIPMSPYAKAVPGIADDLFERGTVPMTKQEIRVLILTKLGIAKEDVCWDVGAGTGSVSVEMALHAEEVWAVECNEEACELIRTNREKFCAWNLHIQRGTAPVALEGLPTPDVVFIGGSKGHLSEIIDRAVEKNPDCRILISAVTLETIGRATACLEDRGYETEVTEIAVSRTVMRGAYHMLQAQNPIFLIAGRRK